jgi:signal transduction histidine kinase/CHASE2 domain-containing sensor protein
MNWVGGRFQKLRYSLATGAVVAVLVGLLWQFSAFVGFRLRLSNFYYVAKPTSGNIVIVAIDDNSIRQYGEAYQDWSRARYGALLDRLTQADARVVVFDMLFTEPRAGDSELEEALLRASASGTRVVLAAAGNGASGVTQNCGTEFAGELLPLARFTKWATYVSYANACQDADGIVRHYYSNGSFNNETRFSLAVSTYLAYFNISPTLASQLVTISSDSITLPPDVVVPMDNNGLWLMDYYGPPGQTFETHAIYDVVEGNTDPEAFADKIVLVGLMNVTGAVDQRLTPTSVRGTLMAGVEINANATETLLANGALTYESRTSQLITIIAIALLGSVAYAHLRWYWMIALAGVFLSVWLVYASVTFDVRSVILNPLHPNLTILVALIASIGVRISTEIRQRQQVENELQSVLLVSQQQMNLSRILPLIVDDLKTMSGAPTGAIWMRNRDSEFSVFRKWGADAPYDAVSQKAARAEAAQLENRFLAVPVRWQSRVLAVFTVHLPQLSRAKMVQAQVERFGVRIAANLENARLFSETQSQNKLLQSILEESPAGIIVLDDALNLERYNDMVIEWLQIKGSADFRGQPLSAALEAGSVDDETWMNIGRGLLSQQPFRLEVQSGRRTFQLDAAHIAGDRRWVITLGDITGLAELNQLKTRMIRMASHDLKNPLGRIIGYGELIEEVLDSGDDPSQTRIFLQRIIKSAEEMNDIITEILDLEHIRAGLVAPEPLDMTNVVRYVAERHQTDADMKRQTLTLHMPDDLPPVTGDYNHMVQAVSNLVGNAIKYTPEDGHINVSLLAKDGHIELSVADDGYGMPEEALDRLFTEFYRVRTEQTKNIKGTGLGLSLVKSVVEAHKGRIWVESEEGVGSTFYVKLPIADEASAAAL